ncbi:hypothetical protein JFL47_06525 [Haemophilus haemoglobinophilus]|nr:hypothetical protein [Canicola haemoglobinophilus]MBN6710882.1 hypothetical protein [Canicola haemoglobinophilus]
MTCNTKLKNIDIAQLAEIFKQKQPVVTQDRFILDNRENRFLLWRENNNMRVDDFYFEINLSNPAILEKLIDVVGNIVCYYEKCAKSLPAENEFLCKFELNELYINFQSLIKEVMDIVSFLLTFIRFLYFHHIQNN